MALIQFTRNYRDQGTDTGYLFEFDAIGLEACRTRHERCARPAGRRRMMPSPARWTRPSPISANAIVAAIGPMTVAGRTSADRAS